MSFPINVITRTWLPFVKGYSNEHVDFHTNLHNMFNKANRNQGDPFQNTQILQDVWIISVTFRCCLSVAMSSPTKYTLSSARIWSQVMLGRLLRRLSIIYGEPRGRTCLLTRLYRLAPPVSQNDYGTEALEAIMATIGGGMATTSDRPASIMAGYPQEMDRLVALNQGLKRRVTHVFQFED